MMDKEEMLLLLDELAKEIAFNNWFDKSKSRAYIVTLGEASVDIYNRYFGDKSKPKEPHKLYSAENFKQVGESCPDCKTELVGECNFCHNCGQAIRREIM